MADDIQPELKIEYSKDGTEIWCNVRERFVAVQREGLEEEVRQKTIIDIVNHYKYPFKHIDVEVGVRIRPDEPPRRSDIIIYKEPERLTPLVVIENKRPDIGSGADQAERYARIMGAEYAKYTDGVNEESRRLVYIPGQAPEVIGISDFPPFGEQVVYLIYELKPFSNLKTVLESCHNDLRRVGKDPVESFRIMSKIVVAKIFDERHTPADKPYQMQWGKNETEVEVAARVRSLLKIAIETLTSRNDGEVLEDRNIDVADSTIATIVKKIQRYSFIQTSVDAKGTVFETFIDAAFRGPFGQYFTPRTIVNFMVEMANPEEHDLVIDPACGSGGFLIYILTHVRNIINNLYKDRLDEFEIGRKIFEFAQDNLFGIDIATLPEFAAKVNMLVNDDGRGNIYRQSGLTPTSELPRRIAQKAGQFTLAITNPPFGVMEQNQHYLMNFDTAKKDNGELREQQDTKVLFIERCLQLVQPGGKVMIVLPNGILNNPSEEYKRVRGYIREKAIIKAVIRLRDDAFIHTGTGNKTCLVLLQKKQQSEVQSSIFMAWVNNIGYDKQGKSENSKGVPIQNDLPLVLEKYLEWERTGLFESSEDPLVFLVPPEDQKSSLDPRFYDPALTQRLKELKERMTFIRLGDYLEEIPTGVNTNNSDSEFDEENNNETIEEEQVVDTSKVIKGKAPRSYVKDGIKVIMISQIKQVNGVFVIDQINTNLISPEAHGKAEISNLNPGEIIFAITGATIGKVAMVPDSIGEANICSDIAKIKIDSGKIDPYYVFGYLSSELGQLQIRSRISGSTNEHLSPLAIEDLEIPLPSEETVNQISSKYQTTLRSIEAIVNNVSTAQEIVREVIGAPAEIESDE